MSRELLSFRLGVFVLNPGCRLLNTIRQSDYYLLTEDFDSCELPPSLDVDVAFPC